jgi:uncharacterized protein
MELIIHQDVKSYASAVFPFLEMNEAENGLLLGILGTLHDESPITLPFMAEVKRGEQTAAAAFYHARNLIVTRGLEDAIEELSRKLIEMHVDAPSVVGPSAISQSFAETWGKRRRCSAALSMDQCIYQLTDVVWPTDVPGEMRLMTADDVDLVTQWIRGFNEEALPDEPHRPEDARRNAESRPQRRMTFIWDAAGASVAMASLARPTRRGITVNAVYTPPEYRKHGYATALTAAVSAEGLRRGKSFCVLYTDLSNPTSNSIYPKIGYKPISGSRQYRFEY